MQSLSGAMKNIDYCAEHYSFVSANCRYRLFQHTGMTKQNRRCLLNVRTEIKNLYVVLFILLMSFYPMKTHDVTLLVGLFSIEFPLKASFTL